MRIMMVGLHAQLVGGLETYSRDVALALRRLDHEVRVVSALEPPGEFPGWDGIPVQGFAPVNSLLYRAYFRVWPSLLAHYLRQKDQEYDLTLIMHPYAAAAAQRANIKRYLVWTYGIEIWGNWSPVLYTGLARAAQIVTISNHTRDAVAAHLPNQILTIVSPAVDTDRFKPARLPREIAPPYRLLTVGRLAASERYKGHDMVIRNLLAIQAAIGAPIEYWIVGDGDDRSRLISLAASYGVSKEVHFLGRVPDENLVETYQACDVFVMPSMVELRPNGTWTGEGFAVDPNDDAGLVNIIVRLLSNPIMARQMGVAGRARVESDFSYDTLSRTLYELLEQI